MEAARRDNQPGAEPGDSRPGCGGSGTATLRLEREQEVRAIVARIGRGDAPMGRDEVVQVLRAHKPVFLDRFEVAHLRLFGSVARDEAGLESDLDLLVRFKGPSKPDTYFGLQFYLEDLLGREIDLVIESALRPEFRPYAESEAIAV